MLNQYAVDYPTFPVNQRYSFSRSWRDAEPQREASRHLDTRGISGNIFVNPPASSSSPYPGGFNPWIPNLTEHKSPHVTSERQNPDTFLDPRCQSGPSASNSCDRNEGRFSKDYHLPQNHYSYRPIVFELI